MPYTRKRCKLCSQVKDIGEFRFNARGNAVLYCRKCETELTAERKVENKTMRAMWTLLEMAEAHGDTDFMAEIKAFAHRIGYAAPSTRKELAGSGFTVGPLGGVRVEGFAERDAEARAAIREAESLIDLPTLEP